jgi:hypothetical protein
MTITTIRTERRPVAAGFSLTEVIIGSSLSVIVLAGVLSAFLMLSRSGMNAAAYSVAEAEIRRAVEQFSQDVRMATTLNWTSSKSLTLTLAAPNDYSTFQAPNTNQVTYTYDSATRTFYRLTRPKPAPQAPEILVLVRDVSSFDFHCYKRDDSYMDPAASPAPNFNTDAKRIQISLNVRRTGTTLVAANTTMVMASFILRNKLVN